MASALITKLPVCCKQNKNIFRLRRGLQKTEKKSYATESSNKTPDNDFSFSEAEVKVNFEERGNMILSSGKLAKIADGCALVTFKNTTVMAAVVSKVNTNETSSFVPLTVSYRLKAAALGRIPLNFFRREIGQSEHEVLTSRMIDRSIRPLFPKGFNWDTQIMCNPLAIDGSNFPDVLSINAASAALAVSDVPWNHPVGAVRIGLIDEEPIVNPTKLELKESQLNVVIASRHGKAVTMLDGCASNVTQNNLYKCLKVGIKECQKIVAGIESLKKLVGKEKRTFEKAPVNKNLELRVASLSADRLRHIFQDHTHSKLSRDEEIFELQKEVVKAVSEEYSKDVVPAAAAIFTDLCKKVYKELIFETGIRCDGRTLKELRKINSQVDLYEPLHGSALFQRGQTQVLCTVALDSPHSALKMDKISMLTSGLKEKNFFVHYEFPPFATKETKRLGPVGRREIGHGALAEKALRSNIPEEFPFTIRLTSEVLESNGSSSMATVCGGTLALMDAGVPISKPCAGVAMGLVSTVDKDNEVDNYRILTDILGLEDYLGEMDFKIAGTKKGYCAFQLDVKNFGIPAKLVFEILGQAKDAIHSTLNEMMKTCPEVRIRNKDNWPVMQNFKIPFNLRAKFLGPGGINVKKLETSIGVEVSEMEAGEFMVFAPNKEAMKETSETIEEILRSNEEVPLEFGGVYSALITEIKENGCMVTLSSNMKPVHLHVSQLDIRKVSHPSALGLQVGQEIKVKYFGRDPVSGAMRLSRKVLLGPASEVVKTFVKKSEESVESEKVANEKGS